MKEQSSATESAERLTSRVEDVAGPVDWAFLVAACDMARAERLKRAFERTGAGFLHAVQTGQEVLQYFGGGGVYGNRAEYPLPKVVLLEVDLPGKDGFEVLRWLRNQRRLKTLRIVILTSHNRSAEADRARELGADFYLTKPNAFEDLVEMGRCLKKWLGCEQPPIHETPD